MEKPLVLTDQTLVDHDLSSVFAHYLDPQPSLSLAEVKFKKKEDVDSLAKSVLKHRIQALTGKNLQKIESELGKSFDKVEDLRRLAKLLLWEAFGKLPAKKTKNAVVTGKKRGLEPEEVEEVHLEPLKKRGRKSLNVMGTPKMATPASSARSRRSMLPSIPMQTVEDEAEEEEVEEVEVDLSDLGPNPTPQMIEMKKKQLSVASKKSPRKNAPTKTVTKKKVTVQAPKPKAHFTGNNRNAVYLIATDILDKNQGALELSKLQGRVGPSFQGVHLTFVHTYVDWSPTDVFGLAMNIKQLNRKASLDSFLIMIGCGITNVQLFREALFRHTKHVQLVVFEKQDMNKKADGNDTMLRETTALFLLAYFFPGCSEEDSLPTMKMVRPGMTTCFHTRDNEDLENTVINAFSEEGDWIFDVCCGSRELTLAAQKCGRNAIAFESDESSLMKLSQKASAISYGHDKDFRQGIDGKIIQI